MYRVLAAILAPRLFISACPCTFVYLRLDCNRIVNLDASLRVADTEMKGKSEDLMGPVSVAPFDVMQQRTAMLADTGIAMIPPQTRMMDIPGKQLLPLTQAANR